MSEIGFRWSKVALAAVVATVTLGVLPAKADPGDAGRLLALTNQVRGSRGLPALTIDGRLTAVAQAWAVELAGRGAISHNPSVRSQVTGWKVLGENVGVGGTADAVHAGFVASPTHYANLVDSAYTKVGFGIVRPDARIFIVEVFMLPAPAGTTASARVAVAPPSGAAAAQAPAGPAPELSPWMVYSMERLRSMGFSGAG